MTTLTINLTAENRYKHQHPLRQLRHVLPVDGMDCTSISVDIDAAYLKACQELQGLTTLLQDPKVDVEFDGSNITRLRCMAEGLTQRLNDIRFQLEIRCR
jgi:hypothetical protein